MMRWNDFAFARKSASLGHPIGALEPLERLQTKLAKLATELGLTEIKAQGYQSKTAFIEKKLYLLRSYP